MIKPSLGRVARMTRDKKPLRDLVTQLCKSMDIMCINHGIKVSMEKGVHKTYMVLISWKNVI